ncbi:MAG TPA: hypothetical protein EYH34_18605 [Planctomycetes bacterium]|nr:hypothetical protein [Planctomycetota bacterium]
MVFTRLRNRRRMRPARRLGYEALEPRLLLSVTGEEQELVYLLNRARHDPVAYQLEEDLSVDLSDVSPRPPLAVNDSLFASAGFHAEEMATYDYFDHQSPITGDWPNKMARDHGYALPASWSNDANYIESIGAGTWYYPASVPLKELIEDIGIDPPGHRIHLLGISDFHAGNREIGVGYAFNASSMFDHYWAIHATRRSTDDIFLTGVVFTDDNGDGRYDAGEGLAGVTIDAGGQSTATNAAGGWSIQVTPGQYTVTASGGGFSGTSTAHVLVGNDNIEIDFISGQPWGVINFEENTPPAAADDLYLATRDAALNVPAAGVLANDTDADQDPLSALLVTANDPASVSLQADGSFTYTPPPGFTGTDRFIYRADDGTALSEAATVTIGVAEPLGVTDSWQASGLDPSAGDVWYHFQTARAGYVTWVTSGGEATVTLYDPSGNQLAVSTPQGDGQRVDYLADAAGQAYYVRVAGSGNDIQLRLANLVQLTGTALTVYGTADADVFQYGSSASYQVTINGLGYRFQDGLLATVQFTGGAGPDTALLFGSAAAETFSLYPDHGSMVRDGLEVNVAETSTIRVRGQGGSDVAHLYDSPADDVYTGTSAYGRLVEPGSGLFLMASQVGQITVHGSGQGNDVARLYGTPGDDQAQAGPAAASLSGSGFSHQVIGFPAVHMFADEIGSPGDRGNDRLQLSDSPGDDVFTARLSEVSLAGDTWFVRGVGFDTAEATATTGADEGWFYGTPGNERYEGRPDQITFTGTVAGSTYTNLARRFPWAVAFAKAGSDDQAELFDTAGKDGFMGTFVYGRMAGTRDDGVGYFHRTVRFDSVIARSSGGDDVARFEDGPFNDTFDAQPEVAWLNNGKAIQRVEGFPLVIATDVENPDAQGQDADVGTSVAYLTGHNLVEKPDGTRVVTGQTGAGQAYVIRAEAFDQYHYSQLSEPAGPPAAVGAAAGGSDRLEQTLAAVAQEMARLAKRLPDQPQHTDAVDWVLEHIRWLGDRQGALRL